MVEFDKEALEVTKYADLVKLAKQHDVYRRYAPKTELVEKLMGLCDTPVESLNDVSMPSFMENDETESDEAEHDTENIFPDKSRIRGKKVTSSELKPSKVSYSSPRVPLLVKEKNFTHQAKALENAAPIVKSRSSTPQPLRKSLAGPAKASTHDQKLKRQGTFEIETNSSAAAGLDQSTTRRLTRQRTFEVKEETGHKMKRDGTFDIETKDEDVQRTVKIKEKSSGLKRQGTFEITELKTDTEKKPDNSQPHKLRREGTFEVENTSTSKRSSRVSNIKALAVPTPKAKTSSNRLSECRRQSARASLRSPYQRISAATPSSVQPLDKNVSGLSVPRRFITSRAKPVELSPANKTPAVKSRVPSVMNQIEQSKAEVSAKKIAEATGEKPVLARKVPDFNAIHKRLFGKMESLVDSRQKVIDKANSMCKSQQKCGITKSSPTNKRVVRKLLSPKVGKSKHAGVKARLPSPKSKIPTPKVKIQVPSPRSKFTTATATPRGKAAFQNVASEYASQIVCIQKRPSIGSHIPGVSKLQSPRFEARGQSTTTHFGFTKTEPLRKEALKASVMTRQPLKRNNTMAKAKQALQSVRLNKRFELQMKHRMAQQEQGL